MNNLAIVITWSQTSWLKIWHHNYHAITVWTLLAMQHSKVWHLLTECLSLRLHLLHLWVAPQRFRVLKDSLHHTIEWLSVVLWGIFWFWMYGFIPSECFLLRVMTVSATRTGVSVQARQGVTWTCSAARCSNITQTVSTRASNSAANVWIPRCLRPS